MKNISRNFVFVGLSIFLILSIFFSGFYIGNSNKNRFSGGKVNAGEPIDLEPFWRVWSILEDKYVPSNEEVVTDEYKLYGAISGLTSSLGDPYTVFLPPQQNEDFQSNISGNFEGVGMEIGIQDDLLTVIAPLKGSPAEKAGIESGDIISHINDKITDGMSVEEAVDMIRGKGGTSVKLVILRKGENEPINVSVTRAVIDIPTIDTEIRDDGIFVISLYSFNAKSAELFRGALREFIMSKKNKMIIDLRGNPGGFLESSIDITSWFLDAGKVIVKEDFGDKKEERVMRSKGYNIFNKNLKIAILINEGSASASEIMAGALSEHGKATLIGKNTFGKGSVQELVDITDNTSLKVTIARWLTPNGKSISDGGLAPHIDVELDKDKYLNEKIDTQKERAAQFLLEGK